MSDLRERFAQKAAAVGAVVSAAPDDAAARGAAGHDDGDRIAAGLFAVAETGSVAVALPRAARTRHLG